MCHHGTIENLGCVPPVASAPSPRFIGTAVWQETKKSLYRKALTPKNRPFPQYLSLRKREDVVFSLGGETALTYEGIKWERCIFFDKTPYNINGLAEVTIIHGHF